MELGLPERMTQNDWTAIVPFVVQNKGAAEHRSHAQHTKEICGHILHLDHRRGFVSWRGELPSCAVGIGRDRIQRVWLRQSKKSGNETSSIVPAPASFVPAAPWGNIFVCSDTNRSGFGNGKA